MTVGIIGYGAHIPRRRIKVEEIAKVWGADAPSYKKGLMLREKSVPSPDQDTITMSVEAARHAIRRAGCDPVKIGAIYVGSESHPYAVKPSGTVVAEALGLPAPGVRAWLVVWRCALLLASGQDQGVSVGGRLLRSGEATPLGPGARLDLAGCPIEVRSLAKGQPEEQLMARLSAP